MNSSVVFCKCMRPLDIRGWCRRHGGDTKAKPKKSKIGKYPGFSKNKEYSVNWRIKWEPLDERS